MPRWRLYPTAGLAIPKKDSYDRSQLIAPHFAYTPELVPVDLAYDYYGTQHQSVIWKPITRDIDRQARGLYRKHDLQFSSSSKAGLYIAGDNEDLQDQARDRMMLLVIELAGSDCRRWQDIDEDVRAIIKRLERHCGRDPGVCVRYYVHHTLTARNERRLANPVRHPEPPLSPLLDPYGHDHPSVRKDRRL
ncbi:hypothetical protein CLAFUW4_04535 [Fulvia fulva]|uniref:Uncharacterized protein n=1 Tax=Passalora fulva TaxID=5499 RepID=A0A9Q8P752_PASFU|nr:uncharacterized protein CLAFUR5_04498 [Fulvia fulva]KAK4626400.1 hypothetical protein CLAFUR4_04521 [Fulvia fulva]KAK4628132.1 hypothetical protein CLAFUR0_04524 [Fulvia fulva]UJO15795.1 hypothetical protein CLAFUR5_04498 [Fulvia fulva]WPV13939.1 hypothetical protein CLAFUW4_04535 [Fulvia fulva]WPV28282.1 hypothetical protein CLAFUW7_04527 [Fulvia fulva]